MSGDVIQTGGTPALHRKYGGYVSPDEYERNQDAIDHAEARNRQRVVENAVAKGGRL